MKQLLRNRFGELERQKIVVAAKKSLRRSEGEQALDYLKNKRGFSDEIIDRFDIGYCPLNVNQLPELKGRIITPIYDAYGDLSALSTRHLDEVHPRRFWHESFNKSFYVYGLCYAREFISRFKKVIIVEGEFDVISLHSNGFFITVGICGTALTLSQIVLITRYCSEVYLFFDGDDAGRESLERAMELYDRYNFKLYGITFIPVFSPKHADPDSFVKEKGKIELRNLLKQSKKESIFLN
ncbi:hypothetical protein LCGC14_1212610 [marine sediment metagenome]|uniref:Toprim domain-containing protein n=1 Tax=marine sediment metagenome TaxID=412755 RepID=A0A0F9PI76_9ZZZZ